MTKTPYARFIRNTIIKETDWTQLQDADLTDSEKKSWAKYRQALRDLPSKHKDGDMIEWPKPPK